MSRETSSGTHSQRALIALRKRILAGTFPGGTRLLEVALAEDLAISRTPVRAALSRLAEEGLLDRAGGGFVVRSFAISDVVETIELRGVLEGTAARFAAEKGVSAETLEAFATVIASIDACLADGPERTDLEVYSRLNTAFHAQLAQASQSGVIQREIDRVSRLPFAAPSSFLADHLQVDSFRKTLVPAQEQHRALVDAIRRREGARAESIAREHARAARHNVEFLFAAEPEMRQRLPGLALVAD